MHSWSQVPQALLHASQQQDFVNPVHHKEQRSRVRIQSFEEQNLIKITAKTKSLTIDSLKIEFTSSRLILACSNLGGVYPFLNHSFSMTSAIVIRCFISLTKRYNWREREK